MSALLDDLDGWRTQLAIWKYAVTGAVCEQDAQRAEARSHSWLHDGRWWDRTGDQLAGELISLEGEGFHRVPDWWALPWLTEHIVRGREEHASA